MYEAKIAAAGLRHLVRLPDEVRRTALETIFDPLAENPHRISKSLCDELERAAVSSQRRLPNRRRDPGRRDSGPNPPDLGPPTRRPSNLGWIRRSPPLHLVWPESCD